jgi:hypothetical protein
MPRFLRLQSMVQESDWCQIQVPPLVGSCEAPTQVEGKVGYLIHNGSIFSLSVAATEEEVTHPIGGDRAKVAVRKGKGKEGSSSQSESSSTMGDIMSTLKKLRTSFTKV